MKSTFQAGSLKGYQPGTQPHHKRTYVGDHVTIVPALFCTSICVDCYTIFSWVEKSCDCLCYHISFLGLVDVWSCQSSSVWRDSLHYHGECRLC